MDIHVWAYIVSIQCVLHKKNLYSATVTKLVIFLSLTKLSYAGKNITAVDMFWKQVTDGAE